MLEIDQVDTRARIEVYKVDIADLEAQFAVRQEEMAF
jgi:hypothetical protein